MKNSLATVKAIKNYLIELAVNDKLPLDLNDLNEQEMLSAIENVRRLDSEIQAERISKAGVILFEEENTIEEQIKLIEDYSKRGKGHVTIDNIEGVEVCAACEYIYSVDDFLSAIYSGETSN